MKFIRVNLSEQTVVGEAVPDAYRGTAMFRWIH